MFFKLFISRWMLAGGLIMSTYTTYGFIYIGLSFCLVLSQYPNQRHGPFHRHVEATLLYGLCVVALAGWIWPVNVAFAVGVIVANLWLCYQYGKNRALVHFPANIEPPTIFSKLKHCVGWRYEEGYPRENEPALESLRRCLECYETYLYSTDWMKIAQLNTPHVLLYIPDQCVQGEVGTLIYLNMIEPSVSIANIDSNQVPLDSSSLPQTLSECIPPEWVQFLPDHHKST